MTLTAAMRLGPYEIVAPLGRGGMGEVYRARDTRLGRDVAIKVLPASVETDPDRRARFEREAKAVASLSHPNILAIFDVGLAGGVAYAVTELLEGETLREQLGAPLPVRRAVEIAVQIARGLAAAHDKGLVHRDLKPENVFLLGDGQVKILDFGLAKAIGDAPAPEHETLAATDPGTVLGTVGYMAPEQVRGQPADARADLFALGAVLYEMLAGRRAFHGDTSAETMSAILRDDPVDLSASRADLPAALAGIVRHCLERNPAERFQSARDLVFSLQAVPQSSMSGGVSAASASARPRARWLSREAIAWTLLTITVGALAGVLALNRASRSTAISSVIRFQVYLPDKTSWAFPLGAPEGSNSGTISPDGRTLAFVASDSTGKVLLWVRRIDSLTPRPLPGTDGAAFPFWSDDSRFLAFFTQTRLKKIPVEGGPSQTIADVSSTPRGGTWNQDGVILLAMVGSAIMRVAADGGAVTPVTTLDASNSGHQWPAFLPDGHHFLYYGSSTRAVYLGSLERGTLKKIVQSDTNAIFAPPGQILFAREGSLFAQDFDLSRFETVGEPRPIVEQISWAVAPWNLAAFAVSKIGTLTYRVGGGSHNQFAWFDRSGRPLGTVGPPGDYLAPALSPDGTKVAFARRDDQPAGDIWTMDLARQTLSRLTFGTGTEIYPVWTPDGASIVYESTSDGLLAKNLNGTESPKRLLTLPALLIPTQVTSDGKHVLFFGDLSASSGFDTFVLSLADGKSTPVVQSPVNDVEPQLSLDGRWLAYATLASGRYEVFVQPFPSTGAKWQISSGGGRQPMWRGDGRELFFVTDDRKLFAVDVRPDPTFEFGAPRFLFDISANTISVRNSYVPTRDGQRFLVNGQLETAASPINVVVQPGATK
jgi:serine/threonine protein kinase